MFTTIEFYISDITPGLKTKLCEHFAAQKGEVYGKKELTVCRMQLDEDSTYIAWACLSPKYLPT